MAFRTRSIWPVLALLLLGPAACTPERDAGEPAVVARVGEKVVTAEAFAASYAFGFAHLKQGDDPREAYLQRMIDEKLLALEGYAAGLDDAPGVRRKLARLREELLVEQVFAREVNARVEVSGAEVEAAMAKDRVQFRLRYVPAATREEAARRAQEIRTDGFEAVLDRVLRAAPERPWQREDFESPYLTLHDLDPALLDAIADRPVGAVTAVPYRGSYVALQVVDIRREPPVSVSDPAERDRYEHVLFLQKAKQEARRFIGRTMQPLDVRVKPQPFRALRDGLRALYRDEPPAGELLDYVRDARGPAADAVRALLPDVLMTTRDGDWTVEAFLRAYPVDRYPLSTQSEEAFESDLYDGLGLVLRDSVFVAMAEAEGLDDAPAVAAELARWRDKWVYRAQLDRMADTVRVTDEAARHYFERHAAYYRGDSADVAFEDVEADVRRDVRAARRDVALPGHLARLRAHYPVEVDHAVLDTLGVDDPTGQEGPDVLFFKGHTGRPAYPVVDPLR